MKWKPIETAPKDGTEIICWWPYGDWSKAWWKTNPRFSPPQSYFSDNDEWDDYEMAEKENQPTHWMPAPKPPKP